ncbi:hypothetical protein BGX26_008645 [Mortierella sp. AD094]|nr:hypothetical protein BGX26_008645 [Mortierella sp. AD094]
MTKLGFLEFKDDNAWNLRTIREWSTSLDRRKYVLTGFIALGPKYNLSKAEWHHGCVNYQRHGRIGVSRTTEYVVVGLDLGIHNIVAATILDTESPGIAKIITIPQGSLSDSEVAGEDTGEDNDEDSDEDAQPRKRVKS